MAVIGIEARLYEALVWYVEQVAPTLTPAFMPGKGGDVSFPGADFSPKQGKPYLGVSFIPNTAELVGISFDNDVDHQGLLQLSVFWPARQGFVKPMQVASQVVAAFRPGTKIDRNGLRIRIDQQPSIAASLSESDLVQVPVTIRWRAFVSSDA